MSIFAMVAVLAACLPQAKSTNAYVLVGEIPLACPAEVIRVAGYVRDQRLKLSPEQAVTVAESNDQVRCNSKILQEVYADSDNYYITKLGTPDTAAYAVVVNASSGEVTLKRNE